MTTDSTSTDQAASPLGSALTEEGGLAPDRCANPSVIADLMLRAPGMWRAVESLRAADQAALLLAGKAVWDAAAAAERERCSVLTDEMLRYAMAAMGTGSPKEAQRLRLFWRFAMEARGSGSNAIQTAPADSRSKE